MSAPELKSLHAPTSPVGDVAGDAPLIVNGLTVRPRRREPVDVWLWFLCLLPLPTFVGLLVAIGVGSHLLAQHLIAKGEKQEV